MLTSSGDEVGVVLGPALNEGDRLTLIAGDLGGIAFWGLCFWPDNFEANFSMPAGCCGGTDEDLGMGVTSPTVFPGLKVLGLLGNARCEESDVG